MTRIYRGHSVEDYLSSQRPFPCFSENKALAVTYGQGANDSSNQAVQNGFVTTVEFHGLIVSIPDRVALDLFNKSPARLDTLKARYEAVRCADGVVIMFDTSKLRNPQRESA